MTVVVRTVARVLFPVALVFGGYVIMHGHLTPGGGFQGGAVAASALAMVLVAFGAGRLKDKKGLLSALESLGGTAFVVLGFLGLGLTYFANVLAGSYGLFGRPVPYGPNPGDLNTAGTLPLMNWAVGFKVLAGLGAAVLLFALFGGEDDR
ncbi:MAG: sodium:proton antiporter [Candidatus Bipolaricaulota bacterium]|nr:sodium:proton antiporter [Candidatus Bipolaricaulota bacterium]MCX7844105.1 sodium:proton antiporter [Candidatus Bipolaricaulota bacterium]MDW8152307.1 MnhB domain-containing protein [Candidatus Bipolaricaulota bacterium]